MYIIKKRYTMNTIIKHILPQKPSTPLSTGEGPGVRLVVFLLILSLFGCKNGDIEFPDYDYQAVYFSYQQPVRTITLGDDVYPTDDDNAHLFHVYATMGGVNANKQDRPLRLAIDESLCAGLQFDDGTDVTPLPTSYYSIASLDCAIPSGSVVGGITVQLTDAFFADPLATTVHYVLPVRLVSASETILEGKDYTLYALKYKNKYHGCWLSTGTDTYTTNGTVDSVVTRQPEYVEQADLAYLTTDGLCQSRYEVSANVTVTDPATGKTNVETKTCSLILTFDGDDRATITTDTEGCTATGTGKWERQAAKKAWGDKDRDRLTLDYEVTFSYSSNGAEATTTRKSSETLIMRDRQSLFETFTTK